MVATQSSMLKLGTKASSFKLFDTNSGRTVNFSPSTIGKGFLFAFICNHCPFVIHLKKHFPGVFNNWLDLGLKVYAISSNDPIGYPADSPERMLEETKEFNFNFPISLIKLKMWPKLLKLLVLLTSFYLTSTKNLFIGGSMTVQDRVGKSR